jgi:hypothetical protein
MGRPGRKIQRSLALFLVLGVGLRRVAHSELLGRTNTKDADRGARHMLAIPRAVAEISRGEKASIRERGGRHFELRVQQHFSTRHRGKKGGERE